MAKHPSTPPNNDSYTKPNRPTYDQKGAMQALGMSYGPFMKQYRAGGIPVCFKRPKDGSWPRGGRAPKAAIDRLATEGRSDPRESTRFA